MGQGSRHWGIGELEPLAAVGPAAPESPLRVGHIRYPLSIPREIDISCGDPAEIRHKVAGLRFVTDQFRARLNADHKQFLAVLAGYYIAKLQGTGGEL